ncbi:hypothetical protein [Saccharothrix lopnurensis]|uniref:Tetratricopeptide repeat protein n=1 Tax=Saccharothrix lopnurensis TaxID=1670621 RepID=A0ABW1P2J8_9PSEU
MNDDRGAVDALADLAVALHLSGDAEAASARWRNALDLLAAHPDDPGVGALRANPR